MTLLHERGFQEDIASDVVERQLMGYMHCALKPVELTGVEVVGQRNSVVGGDFEHFMLAVAVEGGPLDAARAIVSPIVVDGLTAMFDAQCASWDSNLSARL